MLLFTTILSVFFCTTWSLDDKIHILVPYVQTGELRTNADVCGKEYGVDPQDVRKLLRWSFPDDKAHKQFLYCLCFNTGYIDKDGHYKIDKMLEMTVLSGTQDEYVNVIEDCNKVTLENNLETTYEMLSCFHRHYIPIIAPIKQS